MDWFLCSEFVNLLEHSAGSKIKLYLKAGYKHLLSCQILYKWNGRMYIQMSEIMQQILTIIILAIMEFYFLSNIFL